jgi:peptide/nickel transport system substrate-binding protein
MRQHPIGTGPFSRIQAERVDQTVRNPDYWKPGRPYLDGIEYTIIRNISTAVLHSSPASSTSPLAARRWR